jgi:hypothetical protein
MFALKPARLLGATIIALTLMAIPSSAFAATFCVGASDACAPGTEQPMTSAGLQAALSDASTLAGSDTVQIASGTVEFSAQVTTSPSAANAVTIVGSGAAATILHMSQPAGGTGLVMNFTNAPTSQLGNLTVKVDGTITAGREAIVMTGGDVNNVDFDLTSNSGFGTLGLHATTGVHCHYCNFSMTGNGAEGVYVNNANTFDHSTFTGTNPLGVNSATGMNMSGSGPTTITNSSFKNLNFATSMDSGIINITDSVIDLGNRPNANGVFVNNQNNGISTLTGNLDGVTVVGTGSSQVGLTVAGNTTNVTPENGIGNATNSLFHLSGSGSLELVCSQGNNGTAALTVTHSMLTTALPTVTGTCSQNINTVSTATPLFVDAAAGDFRPAPGSPVIDAGDAATVHNRTQDAIDGVRFKTGTTPYADGGTIDYGGIEYQNYLPNVPVMTATPETVTVGDTVTFGASSTDANGDPLTYSWNFDDGSDLADGAAATHVYAQPGEYGPKVIANDGLAGMSNSTTVTVLAAPVPTVSPIFPPAPDPTLALKKSPKAFKINGKGFAIAGAIDKAKLTITSSAATTVTLTLAKSKGGYVSGTKCVKTKPKTGKSKRCDLPVGRAQKLAIKAGANYVTFGGKAGKKLPTGKYVLTAAASGIKDSPKSVLSLIR